MSRHVPLLKWVLLATALSITSEAAAVGQNGSQGDITVLNANTSSGTATASSTVALSLGPPATATIYQSGEQSSGTVGIQVTGTYVGTLTFQSSFDEGTTWVSHAVQVAPLPTTGATGTQVTTATSTGNWVANVSGMTNFRVTCTAYTSGTATVTLEKFRGNQTVAISAMPSVAVTNASAAATAATTPTTATLAGTATTTAAPTYTTGQMNALSTDTAGALRTTSVALGATGATAQTSASLSAGQTSTSAPTYTTGHQNALSLTVLGSQRMDIHSGGGTAYAADGATIGGVPVPHAVKAVADAAAPTQVTAGQAGYAIATLERIPIVTDRHPNHIQCQQTISTATSLTAMGGSCIAPGAGLSIYITDIDFSTNAGAIAADSFNTLKSGTGGTCGAATAVIWQCMTPAATQATCSSHLKSPIKVTANSEVCWINSTAGSKTVNIEGYIAP